MRPHLRHHEGDGPDRTWRAWHHRRGTLPGSELLSAVAPAAQAGADAAPGGRAGGARKPGAGEGQAAVGVRASEARLPPAVARETGPSGVRRDGTHRGRDRRRDEWTPTRWTPAGANAWTAISAATPDDGDPELVGEPQAAGATAGAGHTVAPQRGWFTVVRPGWPVVFPGRRDGAPWCARMNGGGRVGGRLGRRVAGRRRAHVRPRVERAALAAPWSRPASRTGSPPPPPRSPASSPRRGRSGRLSSRPVQPVGSRGDRGGAARDRGSSVSVPGAGLLEGAPAGRHRVLAVPGVITGGPPRGRRRNGRRFASRSVRVLRRPPRTGFRSGAAGMHGATITGPGHPAEQASPDAAVATQRVSEGGVAER